MKKILSAVLACTATMALATCAFAEDAGATAGASEKAPVEIKAEFKPGKNGISGADLNKLLLVNEDTNTKYTWADVESVDFASENGLFSVSFAADKEKAGVEVFTLGVDEVPGEGGPASKPEDEDLAGPALREDEADGMAASWTLDEAMIALFDTTKADGGDVTVKAADDDTVVTATVTISADAEGKDNSPATGIALAVAPAGLAVAFVAVAAVMSKKKKG